VHLLSALRWTTFADAFETGLETFLPLGREPSGPGPCRLAFAQFKLACSGSPLRGWYGQTRTNPVVSK